MRSFLLQGWTTIRGTSSPVTSITQDEEGWLDLAAYQDATFWVDVRDLTIPGAGAITITFETAPTKDESSFTAVAPALSLSIGNGPLMIKSVRTPTTAPMARWLRWRVSLTLATGQWGATFRVRVAASESPFFLPTRLSGCYLWLRSDLGITLNGSSVAAWADQSGSSSNASATVPNQPVYSATGGVNGLPKLTQSSSQNMTGSFGGGSGLTVTDHTFFSVVQFPSGGFANHCTFAATDNVYTVNSGFAIFEETTTGILGRAGTTGGGFTTATTTDSTTLGSVSIYSTAASSSGTVDLVINGTSKNSLAVGTLATTTNFMLMAIGSGVAYPLGGDAYEYIVFNRLLNASERAMVHRYLGGRYGVAVP